MGHAPKDLYWPPVPAYASSGTVVSADVACWLHTQRTRVSTLLTGQSRHRSQRASLIRVLLRNGRIEERRLPGTVERDIVVAERCELRALGHFATIAKLVLLRLEDVDFRSTAANSDGGPRVLAPGACARSASVRTHYDSHEGDSREPLPGQPAQLEIVLGAPHGGVQSR